MTLQRPPGGLEELLKNLPPEQQNPYPHLAELSARSILQRRIEITGQLKLLAAKRQLIETVRLGVCKVLQIGSAPQPVGEATRFVDQLDTTL